MNRTSQLLMSWLGGARRARVPDLGARELRVMEMLWAAGSLTAHQVHEQLQRDAVSLSTVQSTLERLHRKKLLTRDKVGRAYRYVAALERSQLIGALIRDLAEDVAGGHLAPMISGFMAYVADADPALEAELSRLFRLEDGDD